jgi:hypothetical protein
MDDEGRLKLALDELPRLRRVSELTSEEGCRRSAKFSRTAAGAEPWSAMRQLSARAVAPFSGGRMARSHVQAGQPIHLERVGRDRVTGIELSDSSRDKPAPICGKRARSDEAAHSGKPVRILWQGRRGNQDVCREHLDPRIRRCCRKALGNWLRKVRLPQAYQRWSTGADYPAV